MGKYTTIEHYEEILEESKKRKAKQPWGICPNCQKVRRFTKRHGMIEHNFYDEFTSSMLPCPGIWAPPDRVLTAEEKKDKNGYHVT